MDTVLRQVEAASQGLLALSTQETLGLLGLTLMIVGIMCLAIWCCLPERKREETIAMAPPTTLSRKEKALIVDCLEDSIEKRILMRSMTRRRGRKLYHAIGVALSIPQLQYPPSAKHLLANKRKANGIDKSPLPIPGSLPPQEIKPNGFKPIVVVNKEKVKSLFKATAKASA